MSNYKNPTPISGQKGAFRYHNSPIVGKYKTVPSKSMKTFLDLSLAYTPFVAKVCEKIAQGSVENQQEASRNFCLNPVAVISNGTAVLGLGDIGPHGSKPVMEGKAVLFQSLGHVPCVDVEISEKDPQEFIKIIKALGPSFGAINLEDIKAPECFVIENALQDMGIPVFHDDQHGTAIVVVAALLNAALLTGRTLETIKTVVAGAGAGAIACLHLLESFGLKRENIFVCDSKGLITTQRSDYNNLSSEKKTYGQDSHKTTLEEALEGADFFLGLSAGGKSLPACWVDKMNPKAIVFALANPVPEFWPQEVLSRRGDILMSTGRSDFPNQVNNAICFPYLFRGALDAQAKKITLSMKKACALALAQVAREGYGDWEETWAFAANEGVSLLHGLCPEDKVYDVPQEKALENVVLDLEEGCSHEKKTHMLQTSSPMDNIPLWMNFGASYFMPKVFDPRLLWRIPEAVFKAAQQCAESGSPQDLVCPSYHDLAFQDYPFFRFAWNLKNTSFQGKKNTMVLCCPQDLYENSWIFQRIEAIKGFFKGQGFDFLLQESPEGAHGVLVKDFQSSFVKSQDLWSLGLLRRSLEEKYHVHDYGQEEALHVLTTKNTLPFSSEDLRKSLAQDHPSSIFPQIFSHSVQNNVSSETLDLLEKCGKTWNTVVHFQSHQGLLIASKEKPLKQWIETLCLGFVLNAYKK